MSPAPLQNVCLPMNLDAFVLNEPVCDTGACRIAPITQPDYVSLRLQNSHDVLPHVDLHNTQPAIVNPRISAGYSSPLKVLDMEDPKPPPAKIAGIIESRTGVYLHWSLPRGYRSGTSAAANTTDKQNNGQSTDISNPAPVFRKVPNRWLVVRVLRKPDPPNANLPPLEAWVINSDQLSTIDDKDFGKNSDGGFDIQTEVSPFVSYDGDPTASNVLHGQAAKYIGCKTSLNSWSEDGRPSVPLTIFNTSNPLFPDYTLHNANVFSVKDNFQYGNNQYLKHAECDYLVVGWHSSTDDGPLGANGIKGDLNSRVKAFLCSLPSGTDDDTKNNPSTTSVLVHSAIYNVVFDRAIKPDVLAETYAENFTAKIDMEPLSVGTTPLDSLMTFLQAHQGDVADEERILGKGSNSIAAKLLAISDLLYATEDDYDSRIKASDLIYSHNFKGSGGGFTWHYDKKKGKDGPPPVPSSQKDSNGMSEVDYLARLNELQQVVDIAERVRATEQWSLFAMFFQFCSDPLQSDLTAYFNLVQALYNTDATKESKIRTIETIRDFAQTEIDRINDTANGGSHPLVQARKIAQELFYARSDPTITIAGIDSGWPVGYLNDVPIRFDSSLVTSPDSRIVNLLSKFQLPSNSGNIVPTIARLLSEGLTSSANTSLGFKQWTGQPFCPVFVEWEATFYNVEFNKNNWKVDLQSSPVTTNNTTQVRYINPNPLYDVSNPNKDPRMDTRAISGRFLVLPQPTFALSAVLKQVLSTAGLHLPVMPDKTDLNDPKVQQKLVDDVSTLKFISGDLSGFTDYLRTLGTGSHVKPNVRVQGVNTVQPLADAYSPDVGGKIGLSKEHFQKMEAQTAKTPFAFLEDFSSVARQPFKGVQHGQLAITKLNIVDKFGQVISAPLPHRTPRQARPTPAMSEFVHPCLSDQLCPSLIPNPDKPKEFILNTIYRTGDVATSSGGRESPFIQITPAINQPARINSCFLKQANPSQGQSLAWQTCTDWENPIFGWIVVNYADSALQFFTGDGVFFTSLRFGGPNGTMEAPKWAPFAQPAPDKTNVVSDQLVNLINEMVGDPNKPNNPKTKAYLSGMWDMINKAIVNMPFPPSQYSAYANAIVGKPLALVNVGWSLELADPVAKAQFAYPDKLPGKLGPTEEDMMKSYDFHIKIGDGERPFDGVVCYWDTDKSTKQTTFDTMFTYFPDQKDNKDINTPPRVAIDPSNFPTLTPYHIDPVQYKNKLQPGLSTDEIAQLTVKTLLVDPYTPIHLYSGILPIKTLQVPEWSLQLGLKKMSAFFTLGPILVTQDVPKAYSDKLRVDADSWLKTQSAFATPSPDAYPMKLPIAGGKGMWNWLQPYPSTSLNPSNASQSKAADPAPPLYNAFEVGNDDGALRDDPAPYTLLEGFLQLARPLVQDAVAAPASG